MYPVNRPVLLLFVIGLFAACGTDRGEADSFADLNQTHTDRGEADSFADLNQTHTDRGERLGDRFAWCFDIQNEWDAVDAAAEPFLMSMRDYADLQIKLASVADGLDRAEFESQADAHEKLLNTRRKDFAITTDAIADRLYISAWKSLESAANGRHDPAFTQVWHDLLLQGGIQLNTSEKTLDIAYTRAWQAFVSVAAFPTIVADFYALKYASEQVRHVEQWLAYRDGLRYAFESARDRYYEPDSFMEAINVGFAYADRYEEVDAHLYDAYILALDSVNAVPTLNTNIDAVESAIGTDLEGVVPDAIIDTVINRMRTKNVKNFVDLDAQQLQTIVEAHEQIRSQDDLALAFDAQAEAIQNLSSIFDYFDVYRFSSIGLLDPYVFDALIGFNNLIEQDALSRAPHLEEAIRAVERMVEEAIEAIDTHTKTGDHANAGVHAARVALFHGYLSDMTASVDTFENSDLAAFAAYMHSLRESCQTTP